MLAGTRLFQANGDPDAAQSFYDTYSKRVKHLATDWTAECETSALLAELGVTVEE